MNPTTTTTRQTFQIALMECDTRRSQNHMMRQDVAIGFTGSEAQAIAEAQGFVTRRQSAVPQSEAHCRSWSAEVRQGDALVAIVYADGRVG